MSLGLGFSKFFEELNLRAAPKECLKAISIAHCIFFLFFFNFDFCFNPRPLASACQVLPTAACGLPSSSPASACQAICNAFLQHSYTNKGSFDDEELWVLLSDIEQQHPIECCKHEACKKQVTGIIDLQHAGCPGTPALFLKGFEGEVY